MRVEVYGDSPTRYDDDDDYYYYDDERDDDDYG